MCCSIHLDRLVPKLTDVTVVGRTSKSRATWASDVPASRSRAFRRSWRFRPRSNCGNLALICASLYAQMSRLTSPPDRLAMGARIVSVRRAAGLNQADFAFSLGMSPRALANYERGEREPPSAVFKAMWDRYSIDPVWLLTGDPVWQLSPPDDAPIVERQILESGALERVLLGLKRYLGATGQSLEPELEAQLVRFLYTHASRGKAIQDAYIAQTVERVAKNGSR